MAVLEWDKKGEREYHMGVSKGVLYVDDYKKGVAWNGLINVTESPSGAEATDLYADNIKYGSFRSAETYGATIECYTYPDEFAKCNGMVEVTKGMKIGQQKRSEFGFCFRTEVGNDTPDDSDDYYIIKLIYGATASPSEESHDTINDSPDAATMSFELETTPVNVTGHRATALVELNTKDLSETQIAAIEKVLYGDTDTEPRLPMPDEVKTILEDALLP